MRGDDEVGDRNGVAPDGIVEPSVDVRRTLRAPWANRDATGESSRIACHGRGARPCLTASIIDGESAGDDRGSLASLRE